MELEVVRMNAVMEQQEQAKKIRLKIKENSIAFCENVIGPALEKKAKAGETVRWNKDFKCNNGDWKKYYAEPLKADGYRYANGKLSYNGNGEQYDLEVIKEYLEKHCYKVSFSSHSYMTYGWGERVGVTMWVSNK
jgi:hypothetical protein